eukprot:6271812-Ditylum_brightwellii.AAC.1
MMSEVVAMGPSIGNGCQMKCTRKLCNNDTAKKKERIYTTLPTNLDLCRDKTTFGHNGYREPGSGIFGRVRDKSGVSKGG